MYKVALSDIYRKGGGGSNSFYQFFSESPVATIASCAGSGSSVLSGTRSNVWLTGEMSHHEVLDAVHAGTTCILAEHSNSERGFLRVLERMIREKVLVEGDDGAAGVAVMISERDRDPLVVV